MEENKVMEQEMMREEPRREELLMELSEMSEPEDQYRRKKKDRNGSDILIGAAATAVTIGTIYGLMKAGKMAKKGINYLKSKRKKSDEDAEVVDGEIISEEKVEEITPEEDSKKDGNDKEPKKKGKA